MGSRSRRLEPVGEFLSQLLLGLLQAGKLAIFLNLLIPKLPSPEGEDYTEGLLEDVDLESYRAEARETMQIQLENGDIGRNRQHR